MDTYNVVFEYTQAAGGYCGNRYWVSYKSKEDYEASKASLESKKVNDNTIVIASGVEDCQAISLTSQTPEVSRVTAAIEEACYLEGGKMDSNMLEFRLKMAGWAILHDREYILENDIDRTYEFNKLVVGSDKTDKNMLLTAILSASKDKYGRVYLQLIQQVINACVVQILTQRLLDDLDAISS